MLPEIIDADEEHEESVLALFREQGLAIHDAYWERAFTGDGGGWPVVATLEGRVIGYVAARRRALYLDGDYHDALVLQDMLVVPGEDGEQAARLFLEKLPRRAVLSFAAGWSTYGVALLREWHWSFAGPMTRLRVPGKRRRKATGPKLANCSEIPAEMHALNEELSAEKSVFFARHTGYDLQMAQPTEAAFGFIPIYPDGGLAAGYLKVVKAESRDGLGEWHVVDVAASGHDTEAIVARVMELSEAGLPVFVSMVCREITDRLVKEGAEKLPPRWGIFWALGNTRDSEIARRLSGDVQWYLTPADFDLDYSR